MAYERVPNHRKTPVDMIRDATPSRIAATTQTTQHKAISCGPPLKTRLS